MVVDGTRSPGGAGFALPCDHRDGAVTILAGFSRPFVWIGAPLFLISDSLIATGRFMVTVPLIGLLIWPTYYLGQYGIAISSYGKTLRG